MNTPIDHNVFQNLPMPVERCSASCVNWPLGPPVWVPFVNPWSVSAKTWSATIDWSSVLWGLGWEN